MHRLVGVRPARIRALDWAVPAERDLAPIATQRRPAKGDGEAWRHAPCTGKSLAIFEKPIAQAGNLRFFEVATSQPVFPDWCRRNGLSRYSVWRHQTRPSGAPYADWPGYASLFGPLENLSALVGDFDVLALTGNLARMLQNQAIVEATAHLGDGAILAAVDLEAEAIERLDWSGFSANFELLDQNSSRNGWCFRRRPRLRRAIDNSISRSADASKRHAA